MGKTEDDSPYPERMRRRTKAFALDAIRFVQTLPKSEEARVIGRQLLRSATSVAANYRAAGRARSKAEFVAKIGIVVEEADESILWLELLAEAAIIPTQKVAPLLQEANQILAMFVASRRTAMRH
jgi:four helix bundle protein